MAPDEGMIREAIDQTMGKARDAMRERVGVYRIACRLSRGPDRKRSHYWQERAANLAIEIKRLTPRQDAPGIGREQCA